MLSSSISLLHLYPAKTIHLSRLENSPKENINLKIREKIPTTPIELQVQSAGVSEREQIFYPENDETEQQIWEREKEVRAQPTNQIPDIYFEKFATHESDYHKLSKF